MDVYVVANITVHDPEAYTEYTGVGNPTREWVDFR